MLQRTHRVLTQTEASILKRAGCRRNADPESISQEILDQARGPGVAQAASALGKQEVSSCLVTKLPSWTGDSAWPGIHRFNWKQKPSQYKPEI